MSNEKSLSEKFADAKEKVEKGIFFTQLGFGASLFAGGAAMISTSSGPTLNDIIIGTAMVFPAGSTLAYGAAILAAGTLQHINCKRIELRQSPAPSAPAL